MEFTLTIGGVDKELKAGSLRISQTANGRATALFTVLSLDRSYRPALDAAVIIEEDGNRILGGFVNGVHERGLGGGTHPAIETTVTVVDFNAYAELRYVNELIPAGTLKEALEALEPYLTGYGVTLDAGQVNGPNLPELNYEYRRLDEVLNEFSTLTADAGQPFTWEIDDFKTLKMYQPSTEPAPFDLVMSGDEIPEVVGDIEVDITREHYANRVIVKVPAKREEGRVESFTGDDVTSTFTLQYTLESFPYGLINRYEADGITPSGGETFGLTGTTTDGVTPVQWWYDPDTNEITRNDGPTEAPYIYKLTFNGVFESAGIAEDAGEIATHGIWEKVIVVENVPSDQTAQTLAEGYLAQFLPVTRKITYKTLELGVRPGQEQTATVPARNLSVTAPITDVQIRDYGARNLLREVTSIADAETNLARGFRSDYLEWWGDKAGATTSAPVATPTTTSPAPPDQSVQFNRSGVFGGKSTFIFIEDGNSVVMGDGSAITAAYHESCFIAGRNCTISDPP